MTYLYFGYTLQGDWAHIAIRSTDVFSAYPPTTGMPSTAGVEVEGVNAFHPGPMQFVLYAPIYAITGFHTWGLLLAAFLVNAGLVGLGLWAAWRIGPRWVKNVAVTASLAALVVLQVLVADFWNPFPAIFGAPTLLFILWAIGVGVRGLWPWAVFVASLVAQVHLIGTVMVAFAFIAFLLMNRRLRLIVRPHRRELGFTIVVLSLCWALPVWGLISDWPGNLGELWKYVQGLMVQSDEPSLPSQKPALFLKLFTVCVVGPIALYGLRRSGRVLKSSGPNSHDLDRSIYGFGLGLIALVNLGAVLLGLLVHSARSIYLLIFINTIILLVVMLRPRDREWWANRNKKSTSVIVWAAVSMFLFSPVGFLLANFYGEHHKVVELALEMTETVDGDIVVVQEGVDVWFRSGPAVIHALLNRGHDVYFDQRDNRKDYDQQRRIENAEPGFTVLYVLQRNEDETWPEIDATRVIGVRETLIQIGSVEHRFRLVLARQK